MRDPLRFLLLQTRNPDDPMRGHEVSCFSRSLSCELGDIEVFDLLSGTPAVHSLEAADVVLLGGSGDHSVARGGPWLEGALDTMSWLVENSKPTFASCWGFQALARAMGGAVVTDHTRAEVGTIWLGLTDEGKTDPVFGALGARFQVYIGHEDIVTELPDGVTCLASSDRVANEAFRFEGKPIYGTQFHPELSRDDLLARIGNYDAYLRLTGHRTLEEFARATPDIPRTGEIMSRFLDHVVEPLASSSTPCGDDPE